MFFCVRFSPREPVRIYRIATPANPITSDDVIEILGARFDVLETKIEVESKALNTL